MERERERERQLRVCFYHTAAFKKIRTTTDDIRIVSLIVKGENMRLVGKPCIF